MKTKVYQAIVYLLSKNGGKMDVYKLKQLLYLADRKSLEDRGFYMFGDQFKVSENGLESTTASDLVDDLVV